MQCEVTRHVVEDLWALSQSGEASADSRALVDAFLARDQGLASRLKSGERAGSLVPPIHLSPDAERRLLDEARAKARMKLLLVGGAIAVVGFIGLLALGGLLFLILTRSVG